MNKIILFLFTATFFMACKLDESGEESNDGAIDRGVILSNWADNYIFPGLEDQKSKAEDLKSVSVTFTESITEENLTSLQNSFIESYTTWQNVFFILQGPLENNNAISFLNIYPTNTIEIDANISNVNIVDLTLFSQYDKQGYPAIDYLLYGKGETNTEIITYFQENPNAVIYLKKLTDRVADLSGTLYTEWDSFKTQFVSNNGSTTTSSVNKMTNDFIETYELHLRKGKIGIPAGKFSETAGTFPNKVEGFYSKNYSKQFLLEAIEAYQNFFNGKHYANTNTGESLKSYLDDLEIKKEGILLSTLINNQFNEVRLKTNTLENNLANQVEENNTALLEMYDAMQMLVVLFKTDMLQGLNIGVDYVDGDND